MAVLRIGDNLGKLALQIPVAPGCRYCQSKTGEAKPHPLVLEVADCFVPLPQIISSPSLEIVMVSELTFLGLIVTSILLTQLPPVHG